MAPAEELPRILSAAGRLVDLGIEQVVLLTADAVVVDASPGIHNRIGRQVAEVAGRSLLDFVHPEDRPWLAERLQVLVSSADSAAARFEYRVLHPDGSIRWLRTAFVNCLRDPALAAIVATCQDVTDYRVANEAALTSQRRFRAVFDGALDALVLTDDEMRIVEANPAACALTGLTVEQLRERTLVDFADEADREEVRRWWRDLLASGHKQGVGVLPPGPGGRERVVEYRVVAHVLPGLHLSAAREVTGRHQAERAARELQEQLQALTGRLHALQEEERRQIAREVHDELGQALTALKLDLAWIRRRVLGKRKPHPATVAGKCEAMSRVVDEAIESVRRVAAELHPTLLERIGLVAAIEAYVREFGRRAGVDATVVATIGDTDLDLGVSMQLFRIVQEALTNVGRHARATSVVVTLDRSDGGLRLVVTDNGRGMASPPPGSLGLLGMQERARLCGGDIFVDSAPGRGTSVRVRVPVGGAAGAQPATER
jgi:PAS domain S-box-containing protein